MPKYLSPEDHDQILKLHSEVVKARAIAFQFKVSEATVHNHIIGKTAGRAHKEKIVREPKVQEDEDFSSLPDNVFFQHEYFRD